MTRIARLSFIVVIAVAAVFAQETFRNPALEQNSEFEQAFNRARQLARQGDYEAAIRELQNAAKLKNGQCAECFRMIGHYYFQAEKYKDAVTAFRQSLAAGTDKEADVHNWIGVGLYQQNDKKLFAEAAAAFRRAIELSGDRFPKAHYNLGYTLIRMGREEEGIAELKTYLEKEPSAPEASQVRMVIANPRLASETLASGFKVKSLAGEELSLERFRGKVVLLDFWATWCKPCVFEMPNVKNIWKKYSADQFIIVGVSLDRSESALRSYIEKEEIGWPQYFDGQGWNNRVSKLYNVHSIPHTVLIDHEGVVRAVGLRGGGLSSKIGDLIKKIPRQNQ
jgi:tetratricopeptide (TPR) repeat protein